MQGVFSIPLTAGAPRASGPLLRDKKTRSTVLGEFIAGPENRLAAVAVKAVFEDDPSQITPLVLYGPGGCGKTHLAYGLANWWEQHHPQAFVAAVSGAEFAQQYADAIERDRLDVWRTKLASAQMLVVDDLNGISGKRGAQQELHHLIDQLVNRGAFVIVTTQTLPAAMPGLSEMLRSRLVGGLNVAMQLPAAATRQVLLERYADARGISLPKKALQSLVESLNVPAPALLGALMELELSAHTDGKPIDADRVRNYVTAKVQEKSVSMREIATAAARYFNLRLADLKSPSRRKAIVSARNLAVFLARELTQQSLEQIGGYFGGRDHTTVLHGYRRIAELAKSDPATKQTLSEIKRMIACT